MSTILGLPERITVEKIKKEGGWSSIVYQIYRKTEAQERGNEIVVKYKLEEEKEYLFPPTGC